MPIPNLDFLQRKIAFKGGALGFKPKVKRPRFTFPEIDRNPSKQTKEFDKATDFALVEKDGKLIVLAFKLSTDYSVERRDTIIRLELKRNKIGTLIECYDAPEVILSADQRTITFAFGEHWLVDIDDLDNQEFDIEFNPIFNTETIENWEHFLKSNIQNLIKEQLC